ncbi:hypothetical protein OC846_005666 [Tilletia horrida]|uniref:Methyltransferase type 11 domain-containing protein n=1 Tax=Tilletia horrida TaxID=155126 RepID=A0AAN6JVS3_9BASI|nr:hypothetical protein OC845_005835 [Tilletia horrida]KAK0545456.1 hypothetical protein OC846_005666 [Tilletia horrida]KAK0561459.1 hypothetical protein OC861_005811 [Tilletia horrida]
MSSRLDVEKDKGGWDWEAYRSRPTYGDDVFRTILEYHKSNGGRMERIVDIGCGPGNSTIKLADGFKDVVGADLFPDHLPVADAYAKEQAVPRARFVQASAEELTKTFGPGSVDLLSSFMAIHWIDKQRFLDQAQQVLSPNGTLATVAYSTKPYLQNPGQARSTFDEFMTFLFAFGWNDAEQDQARRRTLEHNFSCNDSLLKNIPIPSAFFTNETRVIWTAEGASADGPHRPVLPDHPLALDERGPEAKDIVHQDPQACRKLYTLDQFVVYVDSFSVVAKFKNDTSFRNEYNARLSSLEAQLGGAPLDLSWEMVVLLAQRK